LLALTPLALLGVLLLRVPTQAAPASSVRQLRLQQVGDVTYFHVVLETPRHMLADGDAQLVPQDDQARHVCQRRAQVAGTPARPNPDQPEAPQGPAGVEGLEFVGKVTGTGATKFVLVYPSEGRRLGRLLGRDRGNAPAHWRETTITLDFSTAQKVAVPKEAGQRKEKPAEKPARNQPSPTPPPPVRDDLEGLWAVAQADQFARLQQSTPDFGFYSFAAQTIGRKHHVAVPWTNPAGWMQGVPGGQPGGHLMDSRLYETTTGAAAIAESLQLERMLTTGFRDEGKRTIDIDKVQGITIAEHPWKDMMGDKKPAAEPLARFAPHDNYYITFKNVRKLIEFNELLDQWGTSLARAYELHSRDYRLKERYQQQLCIKSTQLGKTLGPLVLRGVAVTGSDPYLREGSDVAVVFHTANRALFLQAMQNFINEAKEKYGTQLRQGKEDYHGVSVETFQTPLREVSLHRAILDQFVVYANSPVGLRRILDTYQGRRKALAEALDFQYMRTIFRADDAGEDGFVYLSDAFIRQLVGPASKIKEKRRLEALTSLTMVTEGALYASWETGKLPADQVALLETAGLKQEEVYLPEGKPLGWNPQEQVAVSEAYNTLGFATPILELPIDKITQTEANNYEAFRREYLGLWRGYFDPIGMRLALDDKQVKIDTYILPLIRNSQYNELRRIAGNGTVTLDVNSLSPETLFQLMTHLSPSVQDRGGLLGLFNHGGGGLMALAAGALDPIGKWFLVRIDDSDVYGKLLAQLEKMEAGEDIDSEEMTRLVFQIPVLIGMDVKNSLTFAAILATARKEVMSALPGGVTWGPLEKPYKGVEIVRIQATPTGLDHLHLTARRPGQERFLPAVYYAMIDGSFYLTPKESLLRDVIDQVKAGRQGKRQTVEINSSLYLSPGAAQKAQGLIQRSLERQVHEQALTNEPIWHALYASGVLPPDAGEAKARETAERFLGFVPVSPDGSAYVYERRTDEVRNERHGSPHHPTTHQALKEDAPLRHVLEQLRSIRADLRFREDGIHTVLTVDRRTGEKRR
jgi:hypothetical protein